jgi:hypothetical protein
MGLDSTDHIKSGPSGSRFSYTTSFVIAMESKNLARRANHRHDRIIAASARMSEAIGGRHSKGVKPMGTGIETPHLTSSRRTPGRR